MSLYELKAQELYTSAKVTEKQIQSVCQEAIIIGQERALKALKLGLKTKAFGFNVFCGGPKGVGRTKITLNETRKYAKKQKTPSDWCYVHNFDIPHKPVALSFPAGKGKVFVEEMEMVVQVLKTELVKVLNDDAYRTQVAAIEKQFKAEKEQYFKKLKALLENKNVSLLQITEGFALAPTIDGKIFNSEEFNKLPLKTRKSVLAQMDKAQKTLEQEVREMPDWETRKENVINHLQKDIAYSVLFLAFAGVLKNYKDSAPVMAYLQSCQRHVLENLKVFGTPMKEQTTDLWRQFKVNLIVSHEEGTGAPIVHLSLSSVSNLLGKIERIQHLGSLITDFTLIKAGALMQANGGFLVIEAADLVNNPAAFNVVKQSLFDREIRWTGLSDNNSVIDIVSLEPSPIPLDIKVILIGETGLYYQLLQRDDSFAQLFKIFAQFSEKITRTKSAELLYAEQLVHFAEKENLRPLSAPAVNRLIEYAARLSGNRGDLSVFFTALKDILVEASVYGEKKKKTGVAEIEEALTAHKNRLNLYQQEHLKQIERGLLNIDVSSKKVGQINALVIQQNSVYSFGRPNRITCQIRLGHGNFIDIEREVDLGKSLHSKGVLILSSFLSARFAKEKPLSLDASLVFEQSYSELDGDSASCAELCALLSAIGDIPLEQGIAITGSVNQMGQVQAVGGINEKIEGFFDVCQMLGLNGKQGVIIPHANISSLMVDERVQEAVRQKQFHIYAVKTIEQALEILTGLSFDTTTGRKKSIESIVQEKIEVFAKAATKIKNQNCC